MSEIHRNTESHNNAVSNNTANNNNTESKKVESTTQENRKLDSNGEEIVWEMRRSFHIGNKIYRIYFLIISIIVCSGITYTIFWTASPLNGFRGLFLILFVLVGYYVFLSEILGLFNFKRLYITDNHLIIEKYIGKKAILQLGSFYAHSSRLPTNPSSPKLTKDLCLTFFLQNKEFRIDESNLSYDNTTDELVNKLNVIFEPYITQYLLNLDEKQYSKVKNDTFIKNEISYFKEIDKLREEQTNNG